MDNKIWEHTNVKHWIFSPPQVDAKKLIEVGRVAALRSWCYRTMKKAGVIGGVVILHLWRGKQDGMNEPWRWLGPHFHVIGCGWTATEPPAGWIIKRKQSNMDREFIENRIGYFLDHCAVAVDRKDQAIRWLGAYHSRGPRFVSKVKTEEIVRCEKCDALVTSEYLDPFDEPRDFGGYLVDVTWHYHYEIRKVENPCL